MVRAAASGVVNYACADPDDINWRIRHALLLREMRRRDDLQFLDALQRHWTAYVSHGRLTEESYKNVTKYANETLDDLQAIMFPWPKTAAKTTEGGAPETAKPQAQKVTIDNETEKLIAAYKASFNKPAE